MKNSFLLFGIAFVLASLVFLPNVFAIDISGCSNLNITGETYYLTQDILNFNGGLVGCVGHCSSGVEGDISGDGNLNSGDYYLLNRSLYGISGYENIYCNPDIDCNGVWDDDDVNYLYYYLIGDPSYPTLYDGDYHVCMNISADNVTLDCDGYAIDGIGADGSFGIYLDSSGVTVKNCGLTDWGIGVDVSSIYSSLINNTTLINVNASSNSYGSYFQHNNFTKINSSIFRDNDYGIFLTSYSSENKVYNCLFNNTDNIKFIGVFSNYFNTTSQLGTRIFGNGDKVGGNYYTNLTGNGYSDICVDDDQNGFCDETYVIGCGSDFLPLSDKYVKPEEPSETAGEIYPILWVLPIFFTLLMLYALFDIATSGKDLTVKMLLKVFLFAIITIVFVIAITGML